MRREADARLWTVVDCIETIERYAKGRTLTDYQADDMLRAAIERQLITIGEALNQLSREAPARAASLPDLPQIVGLRNVLVHGYDVIREADVWKVVAEELPMLKARVREMMG